MPTDYKHTDDAELFAMLAQSGMDSEYAFRELYRRYSGRMHAYCLRVMGDREVAEDVFQEAFFRFYKSAQKKPNMTNVPGFLMRITRNLCLNAKRDKRETVEFEDWQYRVNPDSVEKSELLNLVSTALELLEDEYREAFVLREYNGHSYNEISKIVGDSVAAVKTRVFRARKKLRSILKPYITDIERNSKA